MDNKATENYSSGGDSSDDDYCPENVKEELSEEESDDLCDDDNEETNVGQKRSKKTTEKGSKRRKTQNETANGNGNDIGDSTNDNDINDKESEIDKKMKADSLWADFLSDTGSRPKCGKDTNSKTEPKIEKSLAPNRVKEKKEVVTVTKIFDFAGEQVKVTKEVPADSVEARLSDVQSDNASNSTHSRGSLPGQTGSKVLQRKSGIQSILGQINKKSKISTLEKTKLDWDGFKKKQGLEEEIQNHNKGKNGYLEKQDFLQRADLRQFELEKKMRASRSTR